MRHDHPRTRHEGDGPDPVVRAALRTLDPGEEDPTYWFRFRARVLARAGETLARRRLMTEVTVPDVVSAWARTVLPVAMAAAVLAAVALVTQRAEDAPEFVSVEELLVAGLEEGPVPAMLQDDPGRDGPTVAFASEVY